MIASFKRGLIAILLALAFVTSILFVAISASVAEFIGEPPNNYSGKVIEVTPGGIFVLWTRLVYDQPGVPGYYGITIVWEDNNRADENFTVLYTRAFFDNDNDNLPDPGIDPIENTTTLVSGAGTNGRRWFFTVSNTTGDDREGYFDIEIYMQAGSRGTAHRASWDHLINKAGWGASIDWCETPPYSFTPLPGTIRVLPFFKMENLYKVSLDVNLWLENGSRLVVKFYRYDNTYQAESLFWEGTTPAQVVKAENVPHPRSFEGYPWGTVQRAVLVVTDNLGIEIQVVDNFTVLRSHLWNRLMGIRREWPYASPSGRDALWREFMDFRMQWPYAPDRYPLMKPVELVVGWSMFRHDNQHTGYTTDNGSIDNSLLWSYTTGGSVRSSPAVTGDRVYVGSDDGKIYCLNADSGSPIWSYATGSSVFSSPAVTGDRVYIGSDDGKIYCLNADNGALIWSYNTGGYVDSSPAVAGDRVYIGSLDRKVYCLNADNGDLIWSYTTGSYVDSSPAVADGRVYIGSWDGKVYCFGPA